MDYLSKVIGRVNPIQNSSILVEHRVNQITEKHICIELSSKDSNHLFVVEKRGDYRQNWVWKCIERVGLRICSYEKLTAFQFSCICPDISKLLSCVLTLAINSVPLIILAGVRHESWLASRFKNCKNPHKVYILLRPQIQLHLPAPHLFKSCHFLRVDFKLCRQCLKWKRVGQCKITMLCTVSDWQITELLNRYLLPVYRVHIEVGGIDDLLQYRSVFVQGQLR